MFICILNCFFKKFLYISVISVPSVAKNILFAFWARCVPCGKRKGFENGMRSEEKSGEVHLLV